MSEIDDFLAGYAMALQDVTREQERVEMMLKCRLPRRERRHWDARRREADLLAEKLRVGLENMRAHHWRAMACRTSMRSHPASTP